MGVCIMFSTINHDSRFVFLRNCAVNACVGT